MFTSGHMFNAIRHTPYISSDGRGGFSYIAGGFQNQFGVETQIMACICIILTRFFAHGRRIIGFYNNRTHPESAYHSRTVDSIHRRLHMGCWNPVHILFLDLCIPDQEWRISVQIVPVDLGSAIKSSF